MAKVLFVDDEFGEEIAYQSHKDFIEDLKENFDRLPDDFSGVFKIVISVRA